MTEHKNIGTEKNYEISRGRKILYSMIILLLLFLVIEGLLSLYFYQKNGTEKLATIETLKSVKKRLVPEALSLNVVNHNLTRPDSTEAVNHKIAEETVLSNKFVHESWVEYRNMDFKGTFMNMSGAVRRSDPASVINTLSTDTVDIYFFGGSTMFGFNVLDHETIPSRFAAMYRNKYPNGKSIRVHNYATPTYYSYQELVLFSDLIFKGHQPDMVIFLDGLNDFWFATASYYRQSYFSYIFRQFFNRGLRSKGEFHFIDTSEAMFRDPRDIPLDTYNKTLVSNYVKNMENIRLMADMIGAKSYFFCQPSPFYKYPNQQKDPMCFKDTNTRFNDIYPLIEKKEKDLYNFTFLGNMLLNEQGYPFIDGLHYSPKFIDKITERILLRVEKDLALPPTVDQTRTVAFKSETLTGP